MLPIVMIQGSIDTILTKSLIVKFNYFNDKLIFFWKELINQTLIHLQILYIPIFGN